MTVTMPTGTEMAGDAIQARSPWQLAWRRIRKDRVALISACYIAVITLLAIFAPLIAHLVGHGPDTEYLQTGLTPEGLPRPPDGTFLFGTDDLGRDVFVRVIYGARVSLLVGAASSLSAVTVGVAVGMLAGYLGGIVDTALSRLVDIVLSLPFLLAAIALVVIVGPSLLVSIAIIAFFSWASVARIVRGQTLSIRENEFIEAARSLGASDLRIMLRDVLPNLAAPVIVYTTLLIPAAITFEATLSFLGIGVVPPTPSWGNMLSESTGFYQVAWWFVVFPGGALFTTTLAFNLLGDSIRDALDPRSQR
jgi:peptide/nickel transport system permease protein